MLYLFVSDKQRSSPTMANPEETPDINPDEVTEDGEPKTDADMQINDDAAPAPEAEAEAEANSQPPTDAPPADEDADSMGRDQNEPAAAVTPTLEPESETGNDAESPEDAAAAATAAVVEPESETSNDVDSAMDTKTDSEPEQSFEKPQLTNGTAQLVDDKGKVHQITYKDSVPDEVKIGAVVTTTIEQADPEPESETTQSSEPAPASDAEGDFQMVDKKDAESPKAQPQPQLQAKPKHKVAAKQQQQQQQPKKAAKKVTTDDDEADPEIANKLAAEVTAAAEKSAAKIAPGNKKKTSAETKAPPQQQPKAAPPAPLVPSKKVSPTPPPTPAKNQQPTSASSPTKPTQASTKFKSSTVSSNAVAMSLGSDTGADVKKKTPSPPQSSVPSTPQQQQQPKPTRAINGANLQQVANTFNDGLEDDENSNDAPMKTDQKSKPVAAPAPTHAPGKLKQTTLPIQQKKAAPVDDDPAPKPREPAAKKQPLKSNDVQMAGSAEDIEHAMTAAKILKSPYATHDALTGVKHTPKTVAEQLKQREHEQEEGSETAAYAARQKRLGAPIDDEDMDTADKVEKEEKDGEGDYEPNEDEDEDGEAEDEDDDDDAKSAANGKKNTIPKEVPLSFDDMRAMLEAHDKGELVEGKRKRTRTKPLVFTDVKKVGGNIVNGVRTPIKYIVTDQKQYVSNETVDRVLAVEGEDEKEERERLENLQKQITSQPTAKAQPSNTLTPAQLNAAAKAKAAAKDAAAKAAIVNKGKKNPPALAPPVATIDSETGGGSEAMDESKEPSETLGDDAFAFINTEAPPLAPAALAATKTKGKGGKSVPVAESEDSTPNEDNKEVVSAVNGPGPVGVQVGLGAGEMLCIKNTYWEIVLPGTPIRSCPFNVTKRDEYKDVTDANIFRCKRKHTKTGDIQWKFFLVFIDEEGTVTHQPLSIPICQWIYPKITNVAESERMSWKKIAAQKNLQDLEGEDAGQVHMVPPEFYKKCGNGAIAPKDLKRGGRGKTKAEPKTATASKTAAKEKKAAGGKRKNDGGEAGDDDADDTPTKRISKKPKLNLVELGYVNVLFKGVQKMFPKDFVEKLPYAFSEPKTKNASDLPDEVWLTLAANSNFKGAKFADICNHFGGGDKGKAKAQHMLAVVNRYAGFYTPPKNEKPKDDDVLGMDL